MRRFTFWLAGVFLATSFSLARADLGHPVAVRWWGQAMVSIETYWNFTILIDPYGKKIGHIEPPSDRRSRVGNA